MKGQFSTAANGHLTYEIPGTEPDTLFQVILPVLEREFGFMPASPLDGIDVIYIDCTQGNLTIICGWDVWSPCFVLATCPETDTIVRCLGDYLNQHTPN